MGWCSATEIMDAAVEGALRSIAHAWQIASGHEHAKTPAFANALQARPDLQTTLDETLRPLVRSVADKLRYGDWDCIEESDYYERFGPEMQGETDEEFYQRQVRHFAECEDPEGFAEWLKVWEAQNRGR
jgi:hypothetical protein